MLKRAALDIGIGLLLALLGLILYDHWRLNMICRVAPRACWGIPDPPPTPPSTPPPTPATAPPPGK